jgi:hypothetical protein
MPDLVMGKRFSSRLCSEQSTVMGLTYTFLFVGSEIARFRLFISLRAESTRAGTGLTNRLSRPAAAAPNWRVRSASRSSTAWNARVSSIHS